MKATLFYLMNNQYVSFRLTWDFPIWEVLATAVVSGIVTWVTVWLSVRQARTETFRVLSEERTRELRALLGTVHLVAEAAYLGQLDVVSGLKPTMSTTLALIRTSEVPFAGAAADWISGKTEYLLFLGLQTLSGLEWELLEGIEVEDTARATAGNMVERLAVWLKDPEGQGPALESEVDTLNDFLSKMAVG